MVAGGQRQIDAAAHEGGGLVTVDAASRKAGKGGLVRGRGNHIRAGAQIVIVHLADEVGVFHQQARRPQGVVEHRPAAFEFGGEGAVENNNAMC